MNLTKKTIKGVLWLGSSTTIVTILNFVITAMLARLLSPSDFGLMGMVMIVTGFVVMLSDFGLAAAIIQNQEVTEEQLSTFFYLNIFIGIILCIVCYLSAGLVALFFRKNELISLLKVISILFIVVSFGQIFRTLLQKQMNFKVIFKIDVMSSIIYGISSISLALTGMGVWSLVYGLLLKQLGDVFLSWALSSFRPRLIFNFRSIRKLLNFGIYVFGERILNFFNRNLDNIIIGRFLGAEALGFYALAYNLMLFPVSKIAGVITQVIFPVFSAVQNDNKKIREGYLKMIKYISLVTFPLMAILFATAPEFITSVYGNKWHPSIIILQFFCIVGILQSIGTTVGTVQYAKGRSDISFKWNCFAVVCFATAFFIGVGWGIVGVAIAYAVMSIILSPIIQNITNNLIEMKWNEFLNQFKTQTIGAILIVVLILGLKAVLLRQFELSQIFILTSSILIGAICYAVFIILKDRKLIAEVAEILGINK